LSRPKTSNCYDITVVDSFLIFSQELWCGAGSHGANDEQKLGGFNHSHKVRPWRTRHTKVGFGSPGTRQATFQSTSKILASASSSPIFLLSSIALLERQLMAAFGQLGAFHRMSSRSIQRAKCGLSIPLAGRCGDFAIDLMREVR